MFGSDCVLYYKEKMEDISLTPMKKTRVSRNECLNNIPVLIGSHIGCILSQQTFIKIYKVVLTEK